MASRANADAQLLPRGTDSHCTPTLLPPPHPQASPITQKGFRANLSRPLQPRYRQQQPAAQIRTKYSTPNTTMVTISCREAAAEPLQGLSCVSCCQCGGTLLSCASCCQCGGPPVLCELLSVGGGLLQTWGSPRKDRRGRALVHSGPKSPLRHQQQHRNYTVVAMAPAPAPHWVAVSSTSPTLPHTHICQGTPPSPWWRRPPGPSGSSEKECGGRGVGAVRHCDDTG